MSWWKSMNSDNNMKDKPDIQESPEFIGINGCYEGDFRQKFKSPHNFIEKVCEAGVQVLLMVWSTRKLPAYGKFIPSDNEDFAESEEFKAMWRLADEMIGKGYPTTARTFNLLICTCGEAGLARKVVERFIKSKTFNYRSFRLSLNAILHSLLGVNRYRLIEWEYQQLLVEGHLPDILTYNILLCSKYRLGKLDQFHRLLDEMGQNGFSPDFHTFNILLHVLGKGDKPLAALNLLNHMKEVGCEPSILHFTTLIDGLSRAGNLDACKYFFEEMVRQDCVPDVVCYTVMITGYVVAGKLDKAQELFSDMIVNGHLPNMFTYNAMIRGICMAEKFDEACTVEEVLEKNTVFMYHKSSDD